MSFPTPLSSGRQHSNKENNHSPRRVTWSAPEAFFDVPQKSSSHCPSPTPILKKESSYPLLPFTEEETREETPEPEDPLSNLLYLENPVMSILQNEHPKTIVSAYGVLSARLRASVVTPEGEECDADCSWPLFQPFRRHQTAFVDALVRDIGLAKQDPTNAVPHDEHVQDDSCTLELPESMPSQPPPRLSNSPKKQGMTASQVVYARDVCLVSHAAIRLLVTIFSFRPIYSVFSYTQLSSMMTAVLAIPMSPSLPTPNARKTHALAISCLSSISFLPSALLSDSVTSRIAFCLQRAIDGVLGKEGKKGPCWEGLRAVGALSLAHPALIVPALESLIPIVFENLRHTALNIRVLAGHALSMYALASTGIPSGDVHRRLALVVTNQLCPGRGKPGVSKPNPFVKLLSSTLSGTSTEGHIANSPFWALSIVPSLLVLMNAAMYLPSLDPSVTRARAIVKEIISIPFRHPKASVRQTGAAIMGIAGWLSLQPPAFISLDEDSEDCAPTSDEASNSISQAHRLFWNVTRSQIQFGAGTNLLAALTSSMCPSRQSTEPGEITPLERALDILLLMSKGSVAMKVEASRCLLKLLGYTSPAGSLDSENNEYSPRTALLPPPLFAGQDPSGLLSLEPSSQASVSSVVKGITSWMGKVHDITPFPPNFLQAPTTAKVLNEVWLQSVRALTLPQPDNGTSGARADAIKMSWSLLHQHRISFSSEADIIGSTTFCASQTRFLITRLLNDSNVEIAPKEVGPLPKPPSSKLERFACAQYVPPKSDDFALDDPAERNRDTKLSFSRELWRSVVDVVKEAEFAEYGNSMGSISRVLRPSAAIFLAHLLQSSESYNDCALWADLCASLVLQIVLAIPSASQPWDTGLGMFWGYNGKFQPSASWGSSTLSTWSQQTYSDIWCTFAQRWGNEMDAHLDLLHSEDELTKRITALWMGACVILCAPFVTRNQGLSKAASQRWTEFMYSTSLFMRFHRVPSSLLLACLTDICSSQIPSSASGGKLLPVLDILFTEAGKILKTSSPITAPNSLDAFFDYAGSALKSAYPPQTQDLGDCISMLASLTTFVDHCPLSLFPQVLHVFGEGLGTWIGDAKCYFNESDWDFNVRFLLDILIASLGATADIAEAAPMLRLALAGREDMRESIRDALASTGKGLPSESNVSKDVIQLSQPAVVHPIVRPSTPPTHPTWKPPPPPATSLLASTPPVTPKHKIHASASLRSPKRRRIESDPDKENEFSLGFMDLGKKLQENWMKRPRPEEALPQSPSTKKQRMSGSVFEGVSQIDPFVHAAASLSPQASASLSFSSPASPSKNKRKRRELMIAVEVPTLEQVYGSTASLGLSRSLDSSEYVYRTPEKALHAREPRRRVQSVDSRLSKGNTASDDSFSAFLESSRKSIEETPRRRAVDSPASTPSPDHLHEMSSSDDDPFIVSGRSQEMTPPAVSPESISRMQSSTSKPLEARNALIPGGDSPTRPIAARYSQMRVSAAKRKLDAPFCLRL